VPIGRPIDNTEVYILDDRQEPVPIGAVGELYIAGHGLARGYLNRPDLTAAKFVANPFRGQAGGRMYRTGDRGRHRSDGTIEYVGRIDSQLKIRGFRVELGEVESALAAHPDVAKAVAVSRCDSAANPQIVGYVVPKNGARPTDVLDVVRQWLPAYMVPAAIVVLEAFPLTPSGKVDRRALPAPEPPRPDVADRPRTAIEAALAQLWTQLLGLPEIGVHDNFFELGGHSLLAARLVARIEEAFLATLPLRSLFDAPTVASMAALLEALPATLFGQPLGAGEERVEIEL
jgi:acyl carrier protein